MTPFWLSPLCNLWTIRPYPHPCPPNQHPSKMPHFRAFSGVEWNFSFFNRLFSRVVIPTREKQGKEGEEGVSHRQGPIMHLRLWPVWHILWPMIADVMAGEQTSILASLTFKLSLSPRTLIAQEYYSGRGHCIGEKQKKLNFIIIQQQVNCFTGKNILVQGERAIACASIFLLSLNIFPINPDPLSSCN